MKQKISTAQLLLMLLLTGTSWLAPAEELSLSWATTFGHPPNASTLEFGTPDIFSEVNGNTRLFGVCHLGMGRFQFGTNAFAATTVPGSNRQLGDFYMARLGSKGTPISIKLLPKTGYLSIDGGQTAADGSGNAVLLISFSNYAGGDTSVAELPIPESASSGAVLVKLDAADNVVWAKFLEHGIWVASMAFDSAGNLLVGGSFNGTSIRSIDGVILDAPGGGTSDLFVAKFTSAGDLLWVRTAGGVEPLGVYRSDQVNGIAADSAGNVFVGGTIVNGASFGGQIVNTVGDYDVFGARYSPDGDLNWVHTTGTDNQYWLRFQGLRMSRDDKPILVHFASSAEGDQLRLTVLGNSGQPVSAIPPLLTSTGSSLPWIPFVGMDVTDSNDLVFVASVFNGATLQFGNENLSTAAGEERLVFAGSLRLDGTWNWLRPVARPRYATNATPERYFLPGPYAWPEMRGFTVSQQTLRFAGVYLSPETFPLADGTLPPSARYDSQFFIAELAVKPSPPLLRATAGPSAALVLSWPTNATGFVLQSSTTLANGGAWQDSNLTPSETNGEKMVTILNPKFRLLTARISHGTVHELAKASWLVTQLSKQLRLVGVNVVVPLQLPPTPAASYALEVRFTGDFAPNELSGMKSELVDASGKVTLLRSQAAYVLQRPQDEYGRIWLLDPLLTNSVTLRLRPGSGQSPLAEVRVEGFQAAR